MKISKHSHSCLLVQNEQTTVLIDPGIYTEQDNSLDISSIAKLNYILITHNHFDHLSPSLIKKIQEKFPDVTILGNSEIVATLDRENIQAETTDVEGILSSEASHEKLPTMSPPPQNTLYTLFNNITHPGDSFDFNESKDILCLPVTAPWGSTTQAVEKALAVRPKIIIPIHDWHWKDEARQQFYKMLQNIFSKEGIEFKAVENNEIITI